MAWELANKWLDFLTPEDILSLDMQVTNEPYILHPWQIKALQDFSQPKTRMALIAANGSGKSKFTVAPCTLWSAIPNSSQTVVTTASGSQMDRQTGRHIKRFANSMNRFYKEILGGEEDIWEVQYRRLYLKPKDSYIDFFATDEAGQAEGWHPLIVNGNFTIIVDEGKSVSEEIYSALERCNGCTRRLDVSSPGGTSGHFYEVCTRPELGWNVHKVTAFDCPHIDQETIKYQIQKHGISDPLIRSMIFAEFCSTSDQVVITREMLNLCRKVSAPDKDDRLHAGLDLAAGGDENSLSVFRGNRQIAIETCRCSDTTRTRDIVISWFVKHGLKGEEVTADDGGVGRGIIDMIREKGYRLRRIMNQWAPYDKTRYANRGAELWFHVKQLVENSAIVLLDDKVQQTQLLNRYYKIQQTGKIILEAKAEAKAKGHPSPDRADSTALAFANFTLAKNTAQEKEAKKRTLTADELIERIEDGDENASNRAGNRKKRESYGQIYQQKFWLPDYDERPGAEKYRIVH